MKNLIIVAIGSATVSASFLLGDPGNNKNIQYSSDLGCGACIRSGNVFCQMEKNVSMWSATCCEAGDKDCALEAVALGMNCGTTDTKYETSSSYYGNEFTMLSNYCG